MERTIRHRINVSTSVKGIKTWDATVEATATSGSEEIDTEEERAIILALSDKLTLELEKRYPIEKEGK